MAVKEKAPTATRLRGVTSGGLWGWLEAHPRRTLVMVVVGATLLQLPFITVPLNNDEGGFLFVAEQWGLDASAVYGDQWVDRPPFLLVVFKVVAWLGGSTTAVRLACTLFTTVTILAAWWAGHSINRSRGAVVGALIAAAISTNYWLDGYQLTGETIGGAFVMLSCALTLEAVRGVHSRHPTMWLAFGAGFTAACAFLVKQNFIDAALFAGVLIVLQLRTHWPLLVAGAGGVAVPLGLTGWWATSSWGPGLSELWDAVVTFRRDAAAVLATSGTAATDERATELIVLAVVSGVVAVAVCFVVEALQLRDEWRLSTAIGVMLAYDVVAIYFGGSYWVHYLLGLVPPLALAAAFASCAVRPRIAVHWVVGLVTACALASTIGGIVKIQQEGTPRVGDEEIAGWLRKASRPGDTVFVAYGSPGIIQLSGLGTTYPYSWSLPIRVRDPKLTHLTSLLQTPEAPTWLVEAGDFDWWGLDTPEFRRMREVRYTIVDEICGKNIYLRVDSHRDLPPTPDC
jgi:hypothetical protein